VISHPDHEANELILLEDLLKAGRECQLFRIVVQLRNEGGIMKSVSDCASGVKNVH